MPKPYPNPTINGTVDVFTYANTVVDGWFTILFMIAISIVIFLLLKQKLYRTSDSFAISFYLTTVLGSLFWAAKILDGQILVIFLLLAIGSTIWSFFDK